MSKNTASAAPAAEKPASPTSNGPLADVAGLLRRFRLRAGLTQEALSETSGISVAAINTLEGRRRRAPRPETIEALSAALSLPPGDRHLLELAARQAGTASRNGVPRELPPAVADFTGRAAQLDELLRVLRDPYVVAPSIVISAGALGDLEQQAAAFDRVLELLPTRCRPNTVIQHEQTIARSLVDSGQYREAMKILSEVLRRVRAEGTIAFEADLLGEIGRSWEGLGSPRGFLRSRERLGYCIGLGRCGSGWGRGMLRGRRGGGRWGFMSGWLIRGLMRFGSCWVGSAWEVG
jgi:transcriptional regulator with XRE-family HTH domain